ncbi:MAG: SH3 domain-containing protein [Clostridia bacterium]|nr:SH3 domain-containing protein [Clostridia bacterium]
MRKIVFAALICLLLCLMAVQSALAGYNPLMVTTDGKGIKVYESSQGGKAIGLLYNGFHSSLSLHDENGLHSCWLTRDVTVWLNQDKAQKNYPRNENGYFSEKAWQERRDQMDCNVFVGEITQEDAPLYTSTKHKTVCAKHAQGTLVMVFGEFGDDYLVEFGRDAGFMPKKAIKHYADIKNSQSSGLAYSELPMEKRTVHTGGPELAIGYSATGYCEMQPTYVKDGDEVEVVKYLDGWAQLIGGAFIETRFLEPEGDHSIRYARVKSSGILDRLNVRGEAAEDGYMRCKLCSGVKVQVASYTDEWAAVFLTGENGGQRITGSAMTKFLVFDDSEVENGCTRVRLTEIVYDNNGNDTYRPKYLGTLEQARIAMDPGTELTVIGMGNWGEGFLCLTDDGRLIGVNDFGGILEPIDTLEVFVKTRDSVRFREEPSTDASVISTLPKGARVEVLLRGEEWTMVRYKDQTGYVMSRYLKFP